MVSLGKLFAWRSFVRWQYVAPRLAVLLVVGLFFWLCFDALLTMTLIRAGQAAIGAKVEIGDLNTDIVDGRIEIDQLAVANPDNPMRNLFQAANIQLRVHMDHFLRRKLTIEDGVVSGLQFHTSRSTSGTLSQETTDEADESSVVDSMVDAFGQKGEAWLDQSLNQLEDEAQHELQSVQLAKELQDRWPQEYQKLETQAKQVETRARQLRDQVKRLADDPLNHLAEIPPTLSTIDELHRDTVQVQRDVVRLERQMQQDRQAIEAAKQHDVQYVKQRLNLDQFDAESLTQYLLGPVWGERVDWLARWLQRSREAMPSGADAKERQQQDYGVTVLFPGVAALPDVLAKRLRLDGGGTVDGQPYQFEGTILDLTHQPHRHARPAQLQIETFGAIQLKVGAVLDRRHEQPFDQIVIEVPALRQNGQTLGDADRLELVVSPGTARIDAEIQIRDDDLSGQITLRQDQVQLTPRLAGKYAKYISADRLATAVAGVQGVQAVVELDGTLTKPRYHIASNLGAELAQGLNHALQQELAARQEQLLAKANQELDQELNQLQQQLMSKQGDILKKLEIGDDQLDQLRKMLTAGMGDPNDLISRGKKLLFK